MIAWLSCKQSAYTGTCFYRRADGTEVKVTMVTRDNEHGTMWDDIVCLGEVTDYVRAGAPGAAVGRDERKIRPSG